ncbi:MAG: hypothetical protein QNJ42_22795 [Crocosphaera sp.]|nr:hypothetical protein [Crocosphaera sp.]
MQQKPHSSLDHEEYPAPMGKLPPEMKHYGRTREEQIRINQEGIEMMRKWREKVSKMSEEELKKADETWEMVKKIIDENRSRKFFS